MNLTSILSSVFGLFGVKTAAGASEVLHVSPDLLTSTLGHYQVHRYSYRILLKVCVAQGLLLLALLWVCFGLIYSANPQDRFFVAAVDGRVQQVFPLDEAIVSDQEMATRVAGYLTDALSFGARDYEINRGRNLKFFTPKVLDDIYAIALGKGQTVASLDMDALFVAEVDKARPGGVVRNFVGSDSVRQWVIQIPLKIVKKNDLTGEQSKPALWTVQVLARRSRDVTVRQGYMIEKLLGAVQIQAAAPSAAGGQ